MPESLVLTAALFAQTAHFIDVETAGPWDQFPHVAITSPEMECGKTRLLKALGTIVPRPRAVTNMSSAVLYRLIEKERCTVLLDESGNLKRLGCENSEMFREMLNAGIEKDAKAMRCGGKDKDFTPQEFSIYSPKVFALIGDLDGVLASRCLPMRLKRKTDADRVLRFRLREVKERGGKIHDAMAEWAVNNRERIEKVYSRLEPLDIKDDRMADLLMPLQAVLSMAGLPTDLLEEYVRLVDERNREQEMQSLGVRLLIACRFVFRQEEFLRTETLISLLCQRTEEPWNRLNNGQPITPEKLSSLLRPYDIKPRLSLDRTCRGYYADAFRDAWKSYTPGNPSNLSDLSARPAGYEAMLKTPRWVAYARDVREHWGNRCAICYAPGRQVHHRTYERFGHELPTDCILVCDRCHPFADKARQEAR